MTEERSELAAYLADRDVPCPGCGYNLRGIVGTKCPECSRSVDVAHLIERDRIGSIRGYPAAAVAGIAYIVAANVGLYLVIHAAVVRSGDALAGVLYLVAAPLPVLSIVLCMLTLSLCTSRRLARHEPAPSMVLAGVYIVGTITMILAFVGLLLLLA